MRNAELITAIGCLDSEPLANIMLGHRELFHSNFIAWFIRFFPEAANNFLRSMSTGLTCTSPPKVSRERLNTDLWVSWEGEAELLIENKTFSLPDREQLEKYASKLKKYNHHKEFIFLSVLDPKWPNDRLESECGSWRYISYKHMSELLRSASNTLPHSYEAETVRRYARVAGVLAQFNDLVSVHKADELVRISDDLELHLRSSNLSTTIRKLRSWHIKRHLEVILESSFGCSHEVEAGLTRGKSLNSWFAELERGGLGFDWGWQFQEDQFRIALRIPSLKGRDNKERRIQFAEENRDLFQFEFLDQFANTQETTDMPTRSGFCHFEPDFIYRYKKCPNLTVSQLEQVASAMASAVPGK